MMRGGLPKPELQHEVRDGHRLVAIVDFAFPALKIAIEADGPGTVDDVMRDAELLMRRRHRLPAFKEDDFTLRNMADIQAALSGTTQTFTAL